MEDKRTCAPEGACENAPKSAPPARPLARSGKLATDHPAFAADLMEVVRLFPEGENTEIECRTERSGGYYASLVTVAGVTYNYVDRAEDAADALARKRYDKRAAKLALYRALSSYFDLSLPWGSLTGIRPTALARRQIAETGEFERFFTGHMLVSGDKTALVRDILAAQEGIYDAGARNVDLFVGIPFCPTRCAYCSFVSAETGRCAQWLEPYTDALVREIEAAKPLLARLRSVYVGGGTPVSLPPELLRRVLAAIGKTDVEYTVEAGRPDAITAENLAVLKEFGVTRVCVNPQTFSDVTLERIGRRHTAADVLRAYRLARDAGFDINMDLIAGLPGETLADFRRSVDAAAALAPENITVHTLCIKKGSILAEETDRLPEGEVRGMVDYARARLGSAGYAPYYLYRQKYAAGSLENTGYTLPGKACVYNVDVMEETASNVACGANAVSKRVYAAESRIERIGAPKDLASYLKKVPALIAEKAKLFGDLCR